MKSSDNWRRRKVMIPVGCEEGCRDGCSVGCWLGWKDGCVVGCDDGREFGCMVGCCDGCPVSHKHCKMRMNNDNDNMLGGMKLSTNTNRYTPSTRLVVYHYLKDVVLAVNWVALMVASLVVVMDVLSVDVLVD